MINLSEKEFLNLKELKKAFPMFIQVNADELTPIGIFYNLQGNQKFLLESVYSERERGRYSFIGMDPYMTIKSYGEEVIITSNDKERGTKTLKGRVLDYVKEHMELGYEPAKLPIPYV